MTRSVLLSSLVAATLTTAASGCGTLLNTSQTPYGGVCNDAQMVVASGAVTLHGGDPFGLAFAVGWLADMPFSLVGDTLALPFGPGIDWDQFKPAPSAPPTAKGGPLGQEPEKAVIPFPNL